MNENERKPDSAAISEFMSSLARSLGIADARRNWPRWLFHSTDVNNLRSILEIGKLLSRTEASATGRLLADTANQQVIANTPDQHQQCARLYFRPRTPTQYRTEGFRPVGSHEGPLKNIPVMLVYDSIDVMTFRTTYFTDGNAGSARHSHGGDVEFLRQMPFQSIYHDTSFPPEQRDEIIHRRHAEVLVPDGLEILPSLLWIVFRSEAEMLTFRCLLAREWSHLLEDYGAKFRVNKLGPNATQFFFREWTFIERVVMSEDRIHVHLNNETRTPGPFAVDVILSEHHSSGLSFTLSSSMQLRRSFSFGIPDEFESLPFNVTIKFDGNMAFVGDFDPKQSPLIRRLS